MCNQYNNMTDYITEQIEKVKNKNRQPFTERNKKIREQYATGSYSYGKLGRMYKLSRERIGQIVNNIPQVEVSHE